MLGGRLNNIPQIGLVLVAVSIVLLALLLSLVFRAMRRPIAGEGRRDAWRSVKDALLFLAGPFPISIAIHVAVLLFLIHEVTVAVAPKYIDIHLESGGGSGGANPDVNLPPMPDIATPDTAVTGLTFPVPKLATQRTATNTYTNEYVRAVNRGQYGGSGFGGGFGGGSGGGYGRGIGTGFGGFIGQLRKKGLDVVLVIDGTGSMQFVEDQVKAKMEKLVLAIHRLVPVARIGIVQFGGRGESVEIQPFTTSSDQLQTFLHNIKAQNGSFDWREDTLTAVKTAVDQMQWQPDAKKVIVLVGDTPPWDEDVAPIMSLIAKFHSENGTFNTVDVTLEEHELFEREALGAKTISPLPDFYLLTQRAYQEMAHEGGGEWRSLTKDNAINQQVLMFAFGKQWQSQIAAFQTDVASSAVR
jgi:von Willebrand factor type A domain